MSKTVRFLAFDLGAESGRAVVGLFDGAKLKLEEIHRFSNGPVRILNNLHWDALRLFDEMRRGLTLCASKYGADLASLGVDTWGVDFGLIGRGDVLLGNPYHYRDKRTDGMLEEAFRRVPRERIFRETGIQFMQINSLYQLLSMSIEKSPILEAAETLLMMPDLFNFWFTGRRVSEFSIATTTQFYNPRAGDWARGILEDMGLPTRILPEIIQPGTVVEDLWKPLADEVGVERIPVIAPACHDTGSAVAAVPTQSKDYAYISSGTWSLMGIESKEPLITDRTLELNFTNEGGVCETFRFLKNIMGLWLVQECRRAWSRAGEAPSYDELTNLAAKSKPFVSLLEPDHKAFLHPDDMPAEIRNFCRRTGQPEPKDRGAVVRCILESLALEYRWVLERLEEVVGHTIPIIHIVGGGVQNKLLCQFTANATGRPAVAGPIEATATGNVMMQALALGHVSSLEEAREVIRNSFDLVTYEPQNRSSWDEAYGRFLRIAEKAESFSKL
ncbi:MAG: rhamnulokinase [bacterium]